MSSLSFFLLQVLTGMSSLVLLVITSLEFWFKHREILRKRKILILFGIASLLTGFTVAMAIVPMIKQGPTVEISEPRYQVVCSTCSAQPCYVFVRGSAKWVFTNPNLMIFVLVNPSSDPSKNRWFEEWWIQPSARQVSKDEWVALVRLAGDGGNSPPENGALFRIVAVVVDREAELDVKGFIKNINSVILTRSEILTIRVQVLQ